MPNSITTKTVDEILAELAKTTARYGEITPPDENPLELVAMEFGMALSTMQSMIDDRIAATSFEHTTTPPNSSEHLAIDRTSVLNTMRFGIALGRMLEKNGK